MPNLPPWRKRPDEKFGLAEDEKNGQVSFLGQPLGLSVLSRPSWMALLWDQASVPKGRSRRMQFLRAVSSASV